jgi:hypothetical protein
VCTFARRTQALVPKREPVTLPKQDFHFGLFAISENKEIAGEYVLLENVVYQPSQ